MSAGVFVWVCVSEGVSVTGEISVTWQCTTIFFAARGRNIFGVYLHAETLALDMYVKQEILHFCLSNTSGISRNIQNGADIPS